MITPPADPSGQLPRPAERGSSRSPVPDLHHHGDRDVAEGLVDLAVNVRLSAPPDWLGTIINSTTQHLAAYPNTDAATKAIAEAHGVTVDQVLPDCPEAPKPSPCWLAHFVPNGR